MKKKHFLVALALVLAAVLPLLSAGAVFAAEGEMILDHAGLLDETEQQILEEEAQSYAEQYGCGVYVLTVDSMEGMERRLFAEQFYKDYGLGVGPEQSGILFMVSMAEREYITITYGYGIQAFTDYGIEMIEEQVLYFLSDDEWFDAFSIFVSECGDYLEFMETEGVAIDVDTDPELQAAGMMINLAIVVLVPMIIALIVCLVFYFQMKTERKATQANDYIPRDGFHLTYEKDQFLYRTETRRVIPKNNNSGGGGSTISAGGFGGSSGGKF